MKEMTKSPNRSVFSHCPTIHHFRFSDLGVEILACPPNCEEPGERPCIPKCCTMDKVYSVSSDRTKVGCKPIQHSMKKSGASQLFNPPLYRDFKTKVSDKERSQTPMPHFFLWSPSKFRNNCLENEITVYPSSQAVANHISLNFNSSIPFNSLKFHIRQDGAFMYRHTLEQKCNVIEKPKLALCVDGIQDYDNAHVAFNNFEDQYMVSLCKYTNVKTVEQENVKISISKTT